MKECIVCKSPLDPVFSLKNMPASAQDIPDREGLREDRGTDITLCCCRGCRLMQLDGPPVSYYRDVIRSGEISTTMESLRRKQYEEFISLCQLEGKKILEAGCGGGEFLKILADYPVEAYGIEHKSELVKKAREKGLSVSEGFAENPEDVFSEGPFDAFTSFNFLEHQPRPLEHLLSIRNNLTKGGYGLVTVPSFEYILEHDGFYEIIPDHIAYYTRETLQGLFCLAGFSVLKSEIIHQDTLAFIVQKREMPDLSGLVETRDALQEQLEELLSLFRDQGTFVAVWGASHQGFTLAGTMGLSHRIPYIIDSAPFKQGRFAPASHIPILSPEEAKKNPPGAILIVAPGYTEEIVGCIRREFSSETRIYALRSRRIEDLGKAGK